MKRTLVALVLVGIWSLPLPAQQIFFEQPGTLGALNAYRTVLVRDTAATLTFNITGTFVGTISFFESDEVCTAGTRVALGAITNTGTTVTTTTAGGRFSFINRGIRYACAVMTAYTSGTATVLAIRGRAQS